MVGALLWKRIFENLLPSNITPDLEKHMLINRTNDI